MSTAKAMTTAERQAHYVKQNGRVALTPRQQRQIKKTALRLEHGRHRTPANRPSSDRAIKVDPQLCRRLHGPRQCVLRDQEKATG